MSNSTTPESNPALPHLPGSAIRAEINRRHWGECAGGIGDGVPHKQALTEALDAMDAWGMAVEIVDHNGDRLAAIPDSILPITNMCNYCHFKGAACWERENPFLCYNDSRPDGVGVIFARLPNKEERND